MALTLVSSTTANATSLTVPAHLAGDIIVICADRLSTTPPTLPNGFTNILTKASTATNPVSMRVGYKIAKGINNTSDPSGTWTNAAQLYCEIWRPSAGNTVGVGAFAVATSTTNTVNYPALTTLADPTGASQVIAFAAVANTVETIATAPSGMTNRTSLAGTGIQIAGHDTNGNVSTWASTNVVTTGTAAKSVSCTIELMEMATGTTIAQLYQHANGGGNPPSKGFTGNPYKCPMINTSGTGNAALLWLTYPHASTLTSITDGTNTWSTTPVVSADGGVGNMLTAGFLLTNCTAGQFTVVVTFSGSVVGFAYSCSEFFNIASSAAVNGTTSAAFVAGPTISAGSFTPTSNAAGNLIVVHAAKAEGAGTNFFPNAVIHAPPFIPLGTNNAWFKTDVNLPYSTAAYFQASAVAINPTVSTPGDTDHYNICAVALKIDTGQGTAPAAGIRIGKINLGMTELSPAAATFTFQTSTTGNLRCLVFTESNLNTGTCVVQDSEGNTYTLDVAGAGFYYLPNAIANPNLTLFFTAYGGAGALSMAFYDILSADVSPFDSSVALAQSLNSLSSFTASPSPSPTSTSGITIAAIGLEGPALSVSSPVGAVFDAPTYTGETDFDDMANAELYAHYKYSASGPQTWTFAITNRAANAANAGFISFKAAAGGAAYTLAAAQGSYGLTGKAQTLNAARSMSAAQGAYALTGKAQFFAIGMPAAQGAYALTGKPQTLNSARSLAAAQGSYGLTGKPQFFGIAMPAAQGSYSLTGEPQTLNAARSMAAAQGGYTLTGEDATLSYSASHSYTLIASQGSYALTGKALAFGVALSMPAAQGAYALTGKGAVLAYTSAGATTEEHSTKFRGDVGAMMTH